MVTPLVLLRQGRTHELWQRYAGFIDLTLQEFMDIQHRLLLEQIHWFGDCRLGRKLMGYPPSATVEEFRRTVPLTTYADYVPELSEQQDDALPESPVAWTRTSGRGGAYPCKWVPVFRQVWDAKKGGIVIIPPLFAACRGRGDFALAEGDTIPYCMAPPPYGFGMLVRGLVEEFAFVLLPSEEKALQMQFQERVEAAFALAFREGIDIFMGLASILVKVGEQFSQKSEEAREFSPGLLHPKALHRLLKGMAKSRLAGRPMYPRDLWNVKAIVTGGTDSSVFKDRITEYWGREPLEMYGATEVMLAAVQTWDREGMSFLPDLSFLEFIPEREHLKSRQDPNYHPQTLLLDEVKAGEKYEIVFTTFGGAFLRYRIGDMIRITALRNEKLDIDIPQMAFEARCDDIIDVAGFTRMTEKTIWQAIEHSGIEYEEWTIRKEVHDEQPVLHLYIEAKDSARDGGEIQEVVHESLKDLDSDYRDIESMLDYQPLQVTTLSSGTFRRYFLDQQAAGADLAHMKPPHVMASDSVIAKLLQLDSSGRTG